MDDETRSSAPQTEAATPDAEPETDSESPRRSKKLRDLHRVERHMGRAAWRMSKAVSDGVATYLEASERSANKKKDGALRDLPRNAAKGMAETMRIASDVPLDLARAADTKTARRLVRAGARVFLYPVLR